MSSPSRFRPLRPKIRQLKDSYRVSPEYNREYNREYSPECSLFRPIPINPSGWLPNRRSRKGFNPSTPLALTRTTGDRRIENVRFAKASFTLMGGYGRSA